MNFKPLFPKSRRKRSSRKAAFFRRGNERKKNLLTTEPIRRFSVYGQVVKLGPLQEICYKNDLPYGIRDAGTNEVIKVFTQYAEKLAKKNKKMGF